MPGLRAEVEARDGERRVRLVGALDMATIPVLLDGVARAADTADADDGRHGVTVIDVTQVHVVDSRGLRALLALRRQGFRLRGASGVLRRLQELFHRDDRRPTASHRQLRAEGWRERARSLEQEALRHEMVAERLELLGERCRAQKARDRAAACQAEAQRWRRLAV